MKHVIAKYNNSAVSFGNAKENVYFLLGMMNLNNIIPQYKICHDKKIILKFYNRNFNSFCLNC